MARPPKVVCLMGEVGQDLEIYWVESECLWCKVGLEWECDLEHFEGCLVGEVKREGVSGVLASKQVQWFKGVGTSQREGGEESNITLGIGLIVADGPGADLFIV